MKEICSTCRVKKQEYQKPCRQKLMEASKHPKKVLENSKSISAILNPKWQNHFKSLHFLDNQAIFQENSDKIEIDHSADILKAEISFSAVILSRNSLKTGKGAEPDLLSAEFFKYTCSEIAPIVKDPFNYILDAGVFAFGKKQFYVRYTKKWIYPRP